MILKIKACSDAGKIAIEQHLEESRKLRRDKRMMFRMLGFTQEITNQDPLTLEIRLSHNHLARMVKPDHLTREIEEAMLKNKACLHSDYTIEVEK